MSTEKNEISLDPSNMSLEEQAKLQTETQAVVANDETRVEVSEVDNTNKSTDDVRPNWLPEKFKSAEDMAKAYSELEKLKFDWVIVQVSMPDGKGDCSLGTAIEFLPLVLKNTKHVLCFWYDQNLVVRTKCTKM